MISKHVWIPAALAIAAIVGCDSKPAEKIPTTAPTAIKEPHEVLKHLQYIAVRKDLKDISLVSPVDPQVADGAAWWFTSHSGDMGIALSADEIASLGVGNIKDMGYIAAGVARKDLQAKLDELSAKAQTAPAPKAKKDKKAAEVPGLPAEMQGLDPKKLDFPQTVDKETMADIRATIAKNRQAVYAAGLFRLLKGVPQAMWEGMSVMEVKNDPGGDAKIKQVTLGFGGAPVMLVSVKLKDDGNYGIVYIQFKKYPKSLQAMVTQAQQQ